MAVAVALAGHPGGAIDATAFVLGGPATDGVVGGRTTIQIRVVVRTAGEGERIVDADEVHTGFARVGTGPVGQTAFVADPACIDAGIVWAADLGGGVAIGVLAGVANTGAHRTGSRASGRRIAIRVDATRGWIAEVDAGVGIGAPAAAGGVASAA